MEKLIITGASGFLGWNLCSKLKQKWTICGTVFLNHIEIPDTTILKINLRKMKELKKLCRKAYELGFKPLSIREELEKIKHKLIT